MQLQVGIVRKKTSIVSEMVSIHHVAALSEKDALLHCKDPSFCCHVVEMLPTELEGAKGCEIMSTFVE